MQSRDDDAVEADAASDPENPLWTADELALAELVDVPRATKVAVSLRLDPEVLDYFREEGPGYQSRIGAVLLSYVRSRRHPPG